MEYGIEDAEVTRARVASKGTGGQVIVSASVGLGGVLGKEAPSPWRCYLPDDLRAMSSWPKHVSTLLRCRTCIEMSKWQYFFERFDATGGL